MSSASALLPQYRNDAFDALINAVLEAVDYGVSPAAREFLERAPIPREIVELLAGSAEPVWRMPGAQYLAAWLRDRHGDLIGAARIGFALAERIIAWQPPPPVGPKMIANILILASSTAVDAGSNTVVIENADRWVLVLEHLNELAAARDVRLKHAEALLNVGRYQEAQYVIVEAGEDLPPYLLGIRERLYGKTGILTRPDEKVKTADARVIVDSTIDGLSEADPSNPLLQFLKQLPPNNLSLDGMPLPPAFPSSIQALALLLKRAREWPFSRSPLFELNEVLIGCKSFLVDRSSRESYEMVAEVAVLAAAAADAMDLWEQGSDARWMHTIALRRLGRNAEALSELQALAERIDECRARISNPELRAGITVYLKHLPWVTASTALALGDIAAALQAAESAKARILRDMRSLTREPDLRVSPEEFLTALKSALQRAGSRTHLLAFLADTTVDRFATDESVIAVLLTAGGTLHHRKIPLVHSQISDYLKALEGKIRGGSLRAAAGIDPLLPYERPFDGIIEALSPLVSWLEPFFTDSVIAESDVLAISPDGPIHNVPFGMLRVNGRALIDHVATVNIPSAVLLFSRNPAPRPVEAFAFLRPTPNEIARNDDYTHELDSLRCFLPVETLSELDHLPQTPGAVLLYLAIHAEPNPNAPLRSKGLGLDAEGNSWITPEQLGDLPLPGAHVELRACMSGIVTEITPREALGLTWALLRAGTSSLLAAAWSVDISSSRTFLERFHQAWLDDGLSRAAAHRRAALQVRGTSHPWAHPYHWAPFLLTACTLEGDVA